MGENTISRRGFIATAGAATFGAGRGITAAGENGPYEPTWESLDSHPCPAWFDDAKIGIYFHWGASAVSGWAPRKEGISYAEWYWHAMKDPKNPTWRYHRETYGDDFAYDDFFPLFGAEEYDPGAWIDFAVKSGARYVFMNAKHHDGYCLWPSKLTDRNAYIMGPRRDLLGPFVESAREAGLKVGFYYSFYEWYNPLYTGKQIPYAGLKQVGGYVDDFMIPQIYELIEWYDPDFLYFDGEWDHPPEYWKSRDFVADYYNRAHSRGREVMINDRYGKGARGVHGDVFNVEYHYGSESEGLLTHKWSHWRGIAGTFGYNRDTRPEDCLTPGEMVRLVVDSVARNGNLDIDVGPDARGIIADVERYPLLELGKWLAVNGEAVYGTRPWSVTGEDPVRFTAKGDYLYAVFLEWQGNEFRLGSVDPVEGSAITMLGVPGALEWRREGDGIVIVYPEYKSLPTACAHAYAFRIRIA